MANNAPIINEIPKINIIIKKLELFEYKRKIPEIIMINPYRYIGMFFFMVLLCSEIGLLQWRKVDTYSCTKLTQLIIEVTSFTEKWGWEFWRCRVGEE